MKNSTFWVIIATIPLLALAFVMGANWQLRTFNTIPACATEDGNDGGSACIWTDPDTGRKYYNSGHR